MKGRALGALFAVWALSGCAIGPTTATTPSGGVPVASDAGPRPVDTREVVQGFLRSTLRDPMSAIVEDVVGPGFVNARSSIIRPAFYGWVTCFSVNAKNAYGGYTGFERHVLVERDGRVLFHQKQDNDWKRSIEWTSEICGAAARA